MRISTRHCQKPCTIAKGQIKGTAQLILTPKDNTTADGDKALGVQATSSSGHRALINTKIIDDEIDHKIDGAAVSGVFNLGDILELKVKREAEQDEIMGCRLSS